MQAVPGYSGFRRQCEQQPVCEKPGDAPHIRNSKFARAGTSVVYPSAPATFGATARSTTAVDTGNVRPTHYKVPDKRGVMAEKEGHMPRPVKFMAKSVAQTSYSDYRAHVSQLEKVSEEEYRAAFMALDKDGTGCLDKRELRVMMTKVLGDEPNDRQLNCFLAYFDHNESGTVTWDEFRIGMVKVIEHLKITNRTGGVRHLKAPWELDKAPEVIGPGEVKSSQQTDVGDAGEDPRGRDLMEGTGMRSTTRDLYYGTSKPTRHLPGYGGFIPQATREVSDAQDQAQGTQTRNMFHAKTNLLLTVNDAPPGYTGHRPLAPEHLKLDRTHDGGAMVTSKAAADRVVSEYWKARNSGV